MNRPKLSVEESILSQDSDSPPKKKIGEIKKEVLRTKSLEPLLEPVTAQDNYECSICLSWLKDPVLTTCGHRFCKSCLEEWRKKKNTKCPIDNMNLSVEDIFPDNYTKREIENMRKSFPDQFEPPNLATNPIFECSFSSIACDFKSEDPQEVERHEEEGYKKHIDLLLSSQLKTQYQSWDPKDKFSSEGQQSSTRELINSMYERIVVLEQKNREQAMKIERLQQMEKKTNGILLWRIEDFKRKVEMMLANPQLMFYSAECYTDPLGYRFCARIKLSPMKDNLSVHIHLMKSENDFHLSWPFIGRIKISMINKDPSKTQIDIMMSNPDVLAFHRPLEEISLRSFGFAEFEKIHKITNGGFIDNDCLTIKIQMNIV